MIEFLVSETEAYLKHIVDGMENFIAANSETTKPEHLSTDVMFYHCSSQVRLALDHQSLANPGVL